MLPVIEKAVECVLSLFLIGLVGYALAKRGWFGPETKAAISRLVTMVTLPPYLFHNVVTTFGRDNLMHLVYGAAVPAVSLGLTFLVATLTSRLLEHPQGRRGIYKTCSVTSSTIFIGLPVNVALFGEAALPYVLLYFFANCTFVWTVGNYLISQDGAAPSQEGLFTRAALRRILSPPLVGFLAGLGVILLGLRVPAFLLTSARLIGGITTPMAIIFIGLTLAGMDFRQIEPDRDVLLALMGRFVISPLTIILIMHCVDLPPLMGKVFIIQSSLPAITSAGIIAAGYGADSQYASVIVSLSTLMALVTIPLVMVAISVFF